MLFSFLLCSVSSFEIYHELCIKQSKQDKVILYIWEKKSHTILVVSRYVSVKIDLKSAVKQMVDWNLGCYQKEKNVGYEWK